MKKFLDVMMDIAREAGQISLDVLEHMDIAFKADASVITQADRDISALVHQKLAPYLATDEHILVDEEDPESARHLNGDTLTSTKYIWSVDPIDGTRPYANGIPTYGISLGLIKDLKPWMGIVYFPLLEELFYCDGDAAYFVRHAFSDAQIVKQIEPVAHHAFTTASVFYAGETFYKRFDWDPRDCKTMIPAAAVAHFCWPTIGRGVGSLLRVSLWDMAGSWPIVQKAGLEFRNFQTGEVLDQVDTRFFRTDVPSWKLKDFHILSTAKHFPQLKERLTPKC